MTGAAQPPDLGPAAARRSTSTTPRASSSSSAGGSGYPAPAYTPIDDDPNLHPGRAARVDGRRRDRRPGRASSIPALAALDLRAERIYVAEVAIAGLACRTTGRRAGDARRRAIPPVERDLAVIVADDRPAAEVEAAIRRHAGPLLRGVELFDIYRGAPLAETEVSLAYRLDLGDDERTLTDDELDAAVAAVVAGLTADVGARFRT